MMCRRKTCSRHLQAPAAVARALRLQPTMPQSSVTICGPYPKLDAFLKNARARRWAFRRLTVVIRITMHRLNQPAKRCFPNSPNLLHGKAKRSLFHPSPAINCRGRTRYRLLVAQRASACQFAPALPAWNIDRLSRSKSVLRPCGVILPQLPQRRVDQSRRSRLFDAKEATATIRPWSRWSQTLAAASRWIQLYFGARAPSAVALPHYSWDRSTFKHLPSREAHSDFALRRHRCSAPHSARRDNFYNHIDVERFPWLADHRAGSSSSFGAAIVELLSQLLGRRSAKNPSNCATVRLPTAAA